MKALKQYIAKYPNLTLRFSHYYKYTFYFKGEKNPIYKVGDTIEVIAEIGGNPEDIKTFSLGATDEIPLENALDSFHRIMIKLNGKVVVDTEIEVM